MKLVDIGEKWGQPEASAKNDKHYPSINLKTAKFPRLAKLEDGEEATVRMKICKLGSRKNTHAGAKDVDEVEVEFRAIDEEDVDEMSDEDLDKKIDDAMHVKD